MVDGPEIDTYEGEKDAKQATAQARRKDSAIAYVPGSVTAPARTLTIA